MASLERLYHVLVDDEDVSGADLSQDVVDAVPGNAVRLISGLTMQKIGDRIADPKTVLAWLLATLGAPAAMTGLLVPIRESGSLLPQASLMPWVRRQPLRHRVWVLGAIGQSAAVAGIAMTAALLRGVVAGVAVLACLAVFAGSRALSSISYKDVLGRTIPKGQRGRVGGIASAISGVVALTLGVGLRLLGQDAGSTLLAILLAAAAASWLVAAGIFWTVDEPAEATEDADTDGLGEAFALLRDDLPFRRFVTTRALLLVSALSPPFIVTLAGTSENASLAGLGGFVVAQGLASMLGGRLWGGAADRSSRRTMMAAAGGASVIVTGFLLVDAITDVDGSSSAGMWLALAAYFMLALAHEGARLGRSTYVTDMAEGDQRTAYVAASNSAMGVILLLAGGLTAALGVIGPRLSLVALAIAGAGGAALGRTLPEVSRREGG